MAKKRCMPLLLSKLRQQVNSHCSLPVCLPATKPFEWIRNLRDWEVKMELSMAITGWNSNLLGNREWTSVGGFPSALSPAQHLSSRQKLPSFEWEYYWWWWWRFRIILWKRFCHRFLENSWCCACAGICNRPSTTGREKCRDRPEDKVLAVWLAGWLVGWLCQEGTNKVNNKLNSITLLFKRRNKCWPT